MGRRPRGLRRRGGSARPGIASGEPRADPHVDAAAGDGDRRAPARRPPARASRAASRGVAAALEQDERAGLGGLARLLAGGVRRDHRQRDQRDQRDEREEAEDLDRGLSARAGHPPWGRKWEVADARPKPTRGQDRRDADRDAHVAVRRRPARAGRARAEGAGASARRRSRQRRTRGRAPRLGRRPAPPTPPARPAGPGRRPPAPARAPAGARRARPTPARRTTRRAGRVALSETQPAHLAPGRPAARSRRPAEGERPAQSAPRPRSR